MHINLGKEEQALLLEMVEARMKELHPEIRRSQRAFRGELRRERDLLERCLDHLRGVEETSAVVPTQQELLDTEE